MLEIAKEAGENNKEYYFSGGMSIDLALGHFTRNHEDLDFHPLDSDWEWWREWFQNNGYLLGKDPDMGNFPHTFKVTDEKDSYYADVYPVEPDRNGDITILLKDGTYDPWDGHSWLTKESVNYKGTNIWIENPKAVIEGKLWHSKRFKEKALPPKHQHDLDNYKTYLEIKYGTPRIF